MHGVNGTFGALAVGLFANGKYGAGWNLHDRRHSAPSCPGVTGIFHDFGDGIGQLASQAIGSR